MDGDQTLIDNSFEFLICIDASVRHGRQALAHIGLDFMGFSSIKILHGAGTLADASKTGLGPCIEKYQPCRRRRREFRDELLNADVTYTVEEEIVARTEAAVVQHGFAEAFGVGLDQHLTKILKDLARSGILAAARELRAKKAAEGCEFPAQRCGKGFGNRGFSAANLARERDKKGH